MLPIILPPPESVAATIFLHGHAISPWTS